MDTKRIQLTLFIDAHASESIERTRKAFNSEQYELIKGHVTLCREDELEQIEQVILNLEQLDRGYITIDFGRPVRFSDGKGVLIPAIGRNSPFQKLREAILKGLIEKPRWHEPHITLIHPRNATCTDTIFDHITGSRFPITIEFRQISLIEQEAAGKKWNIVKEFELNRK
ncbi:MAG: 2'-5' RNA ligase family protein [Lewinellaceae bacterium]|nr:2'-5' RNA ligase family protein [Lewinellaceae bacterium]